MSGEYKKVLLPKSALDTFESIAFENPQVECLALLIGYKENDYYVGSELLFPNQLQTVSSVTNLDTFGIDTFQWISEKCETFKSGKVPIILAWIHSHVQHTPVMFSSIDVHTHYSYSQMLNESLIGIVFGINEGEKSEHNLYELTEYGRQEIRKCGQIPGNLSSKQHEGCNKSEFYESARYRVKIEEQGKISITNAMNLRCPSPEKMIKLSIIPEDTDLKNDMEMCKCCKKTFKYIRKHISKAKKCKIYYDQVKDMSQSDILKGPKYQNLNAHQEIIPKENCKNCKKPFKYLMKHLAQKKECKVTYGDEFKSEKSKASQKRLEDKKKSNRANYLKNRKNFKEKYEKNKEKIKEKKKKTYKESREKKGNSKSSYSSFMKYTYQGPIYPCISCHRTFFEESVTSVTKFELIMKYGSKLVGESVFASKRCEVNGRFYICRTCFGSIKKGVRPKLSYFNGLKLDPIPEELELSELESVMISKYIIFQKIMALPRSRMSCMKDRAILVALENDDIERTINTLPRTLKESAVVAVRLQRMEKLKSAVMEELVRPQKLVKAVSKLKECGNRHYESINVDENFEERAREENLEAWKELTGEDSDENVDDIGIADQENIIDEALELEEKEHELYLKKDPIRKYQVEISQSSCLVNDYPEINIKTSSSKSIVIAPGEGKIPTNLMREKDFDVCAFPTLHPTGKYGLNHEREQHISPQAYFCQRLFNVDRRFSSSTAYIFTAQYYVERKLLESQVNLMCQRGMISSKNGKKTLKLLENAIAVLEKIRGTAKYWLTARYELLAKISQLGPFTIFITLSCGEMRWTEVFTTIFHLEGVKVKYTGENPWEEEPLIGDEEVPLWDYVDSIDKHALLRRHTLVITRIFEHRVRKFFSELIMSKAEDSLHVTYYTYRMEFQKRGMGHIHGVLWLNHQKHTHSPKPNEDIDADNLPSFIDKFITCSLDENTVEKKVLDIVKEVQVHNHTKSCRKYETSCRFDYPKMPSKKTLIAFPLNSDDPDRKEKLKKRNDILERVNSILNCEEFDEDMSIDALLEEAGVSETEYESALRISDRGGIIVVLKRSLKERFVNPYNPLFISCWNANMDIQIAVDKFAICTYITDYYSKDESGLSELIFAALKEGRKYGMPEQLKLVKDCYLTHRSIGLCEAIVRCNPNMLMKNSNVSTVPVGTGFPESRSQFLSKINDEDNVAENDGERVYVDGATGKFVEKTTIHLKYSNRPEILEDLCLAVFSTAYESTKPLSDESSHHYSTTCEFIVGTELHHLPKRIKLNDPNLGEMRLRSFQKVLRIHLPKKKDNIHESLYTTLLLYFPWRNETKDLHKESLLDCLDLYENNIDIIEKNKNMIFPFEDTVNDIEQLLKNAEDLHRPLHERLNLQSEQENYDAEYEEEIPDEEFLSRNPGELKEIDSRNKDSSKFRRLEVSDEDELVRLRRQLVPEQQAAFNSIFHYCKAISRIRNDLTQRPEAPLLIIHGGAGVGKSLVVKSISRWCEKVLQKPGDSPDKPHVLVCAFTGMAASLVEGITLHTALNLPFGNAYESLSDDKRAESRKFLEELEVLIIDEMSMIKADMLYQIHMRLKEIKGNDKLFGGISIVLVGDLLQLTPVMGHCIFDEPINEKFKAYNLISPLWAEFQVIELQHNHRQGEGSSFSELMNRIRFNNVTDQDIELLKSRIIRIDNHNYPEDAFHIFPKNEQGNLHNLKMLNKLDGELLLSKAIVSRPKGGREMKKVTVKLSNQKKEEWEHMKSVDKTQFYDVLPVKEGAKVMLIHNINPADKLSNGVRGDVFKILKNSRNEITCILVKFYDKDVGYEQRQKYPHICKQYASENVTPIFPVEFLYPSGNIKKQHGAMSKLMQYPLRLAWAATAHKIQGQTIKKGSKVVVDLGHVFCGNMSHVMIGRAECLDDVYILDTTDKQNLENELGKKIYTDASCELEAHSLQERAICTSDFPVPLDKNKTNVVFFNVRSFHKHKEDVILDSFIMKHDIIFICETWLEEKEEVSLSNEFHVKLNSTGRGKGTAIFYKFDFHPKIRSYKSDLLQLQQMVLSNLIIIFVYRNQGCSAEEMISVLEDYLFEKRDTMIIGDFNYEPEKHSIFTYLKECGFALKNSLPTHSFGNNIDHIYVNFENKR